MYSYLITAVNRDYEAVSQSLTFSATTSRVCFDTVTVDDDLLEDNETYRLTLTSDEPGLTLDPDMAVVTIVNDDGKHSYTTCTRYQHS